jgi:hypothetical protein
MVVKSEAQFAKPSGLFIADREIIEPSDIRSRDRSQSPRRRCIIYFLVHSL